MSSWNGTAVAMCLVLTVAWSGALAVDADLERMAKEPLTDAQWREVSARRGSDPAFMARAYRLGCVQRIERGELSPTPANLESVRLGLTLAQQLTAKSDVAGLLLCRGLLSQSLSHSEKAEADFTLALQEAAQAHESGLQALALALRGELHAAQGKLGAAQRDLLAAQRVEPAIGKSPTHDYATLALGKFYNDPRIGKHAEALALFQGLIVRLETSPPSQSLATARFHTGLAHQHLARHQEALAAFMQAQSGYEALKDAAHATRSKAHRADALQRLQQPADALALANDAQREAPLDAQVQFVAAVARIGALRQLGKLDDAVAAFAQLRQRLGPALGPALQAQLEEEGAALAASMQRWELAFRARTEQLEQIQILAASQSEAQAARLSAELEAARQVAENERRLYEGSAARQLQRWQWALFAVAGVSALGLAWLARRLGRQARQTRAASSLRAD